MVFYQAFGAMFGALPFSMMVSLLVAFVYYSEACILDMKSLFTEFDSISKRGNRPSTKIQTYASLKAQGEREKLIMSERCKEVIHLYWKLIRYGFIRAMFIFHSLLFYFSSLLRDLADVMNFIILVTIVPFAMCACLGLFLMANVRV